MSGGDGKGRGKFWGGMRVERQEMGCGQIGKKMEEKEIYFFKKICTAMSGIYSKAVANVSFRRYLGKRLRE